MANKEARVVFKTSTERFKQGIDEAKAAIGNLNGELKKNSNELAKNGGDVQLLGQRVELLSQKHEEQASVVENMRYRLEAAKFAYGENAIEVKKLEGQLKSAEAKFGSYAAQLENAEAKLTHAKTGYGQLTNEIKQQKTQLKQLQTEYANAIIEKGRDSAEAKQLETRINSLNTELRQNKDRLEQAERAARELAGGYQKAESEARDLGNSIGDIAAGNMIADFATDGIQALASLDEATQEHRVSMAQLETAYAHSNRAVEEAHDVYEGFLGIVGDSDQATEAALDMRNLADAGADAAMWYDIASGAATAHGDALPIENLIESANETVRCGQVVGGLADALNWTTINQDEFNDKMSEYPGIMAAYNKAIGEGLSNEDAMNAALAECGTEQERVALLTAALGTQYSEMGEQFQEANEAVAESRIASDELLQSQSKLADKIAPLATLVKSLAADGLSLLADNLNWIVPIVGIAAGAFGALWLAANGGAMLGALKTSIMGVGTAIAGISTPILVAIAAITAIAGVIVYLWNTNEEFRNAVTMAWEGIKLAIASVCEALAPIVQPAFEQIQSIVDSIMNGSVAPIISGALTVISGLFQTVCGAIVAITTGDFTTLSNGVQSILDGLKSIISGIFSGIQTTIQTKIAAARDFVGNAISAIKGFFNFSWSLPQIKLPHFSVSGGQAPWGFGGQGSLPRVSVSWYAKAMNTAMVLDSPTIFGYGNGSLLGAGESGREVVSGESHLIGLIGNAVQKAVSNVSNHNEVHVTVHAEGDPDAIANAVAYKVFNAIDEANTRNGR